MTWSWRIPVLGILCVLSAAHTARHSAPPVRLPDGGYNSQCQAPFSDPLRTSGQYTPDELVRNIFVRGGCNNISNIRTVGPAAGIGFFENGLGSIGLDRGIILATGPIGHASGPNDVPDKSGNYNYSGGDPDLDILSGTTVRDRIALEFDFVPLDSFVTFRYVFASEEYCEFVGSVYNDVFGFFISGPGINGPFSNNSSNIALIPGSNSFVSINSINHTENQSHFIRNDLPVDALQCQIPAYNSPYLPFIQYDGFTRPLTASLQLIPCETYRLRIVVADVGDNFYDSAVFLEAESFNIGGAVSITGHSAANSNALAAEGCGEAYFRFSRVDTQNRNTPITVRYAVSTAMSTAMEGEDFAPLPGIITIPAGQVSVNLPVNIFNDGITEPAERLVIELNIPCACYSDTAMLFIVDAPPLSVLLPDAGVCNDEPALLSASPQGGKPPFVYQWSTGAGGQHLSVIPAQPTHYSVTVTDACGSISADTAFVDITVPPEALLSGYAGICEGDTAYLPVVLSGTPPWQLRWSVNGVPQPEAGGINAGPYLLPATLAGLYRIEALRDAYCAGLYAGEGVVDVHRIQVDVETTPVSCHGFADGAAAATISDGSPPYDYAWSHGAGNVLNLHNLAAGTYYLHVTDSKGCSKTAQAIVEEPAPLMEVAFSCEDLGNPATPFSASGGRPPYQYGVDGTAGSDHTLFDRLIPGQRYNLIIKDASGCILEQDWLMPARHIRAVELPETLRLRLGETAMLSPRLHMPESLLASVRWAPGEGLSCTDCLSPELTALQPGIYTIFIVDAFGCTSEARLELQIDPTADIFVPNAFSPNGDNTNDRLVIFANPLQVSEIISFQVFDRWGALVHRSTLIPHSREALGWDGTMNGRPLDPGVYVYTLQAKLADGSLVARSGEVLLLR